MPTEHQIVANLRQLASEASNLARRARELDLAEAEQVAIQQIYGQVTASTKASFAARAFWRERSVTGFNEPGRRQGR